jgi:hypothetical protein
LPLARLIKSDCEAGRGAARRGEAKRGEAGIYHNNNNIDNIDNKFNINNNNNNCVVTTAQSQNGQVHVSTKTSISQYERAPARRDSSPYQKRWPKFASRLRARAVTRLLALNHDSLRQVTVHCQVLREIPFDTHFFPSV